MFSDLFFQFSDLFRDKFHKFFFNYGILFYFFQHCQNVSRCLQFALNIVHSYSSLSIQNVYDSAHDSASFPYIPKNILKEKMTAETDTLHNLINAEML